MIEGQVTNRNVSLLIRNAEQLDFRIISGAARGLAQGLQAAAKVAENRWLVGQRGAEGLREVTGRLRKSVATTVEIGGVALGLASVPVSADRVVGKIGTNVKYAARHEFGFRGREKVKEHVRVTRVFLGATEIDPRRKALKKGVFQGFRETKRGALGRLKKGHAEFQRVRAHEREVDYAGRPFLRPALRETLPRIIALINQEMARA